MSFMKEISSRDNQWVKLACSLKNKKGRQGSQRVFMEGFRLIEDVALSGIMDVQCFVSPDGRERQGFGELYERGLSLGWEFFAVTDSVYDKLKDTQTPQGIAAILPYFEDTLATIGPLAPQRPVLFLQSIQDPGNLGTILRTAAAANAAAVFLSEDSVDLYNGKTLRSAMGAVFKIPVVQHVTDHDLASFCSREGRQLIGTTPRGTCSYSDADYSRPVVLACGNEGNGLTDGFIDRCHTTVTIPMKAGTESLNLSMAVGLVLYKAWETHGFAEDRK